MQHKLSSILWIIVEKFGGTLASTVSFFVYAILLTPEEMGFAVIALSASMGLAQITATFFHEPLVCYSKLKVSTLCTAINGGVVLSLLIYATLVGVSYLLVSGETLLLIVISGLLLPVMSTLAVFSALLKRRHKFNVLSKRMLVGKFLGIALGMIFAFSDFGSIAMIIQALCVELFTLILLMMSVNLRYFRVFSWSLFSDILKFGFSVALRKLSWEGTVKGLPLILASQTSPHVVGVFAFAWRVIDMPKTAITSGAVSYVLPIFAKTFRNKGDLKQLFASVNQMSFFIFAPLFIGLGAVIEPLLLVIFGDKWNEATLPIQLLCFITVINFSRVYVPPLFIALGKAHLTLKTDVISTLITLVVCYFLAVNYGALAAMLALMCRTVINFPISMLVLKSSINISVFEQIKIFFPSLLASILMFVFLRFIESTLYIDKVFLLISMIAIGIMTYLVMAYAMNRNALNTILSIFRGR